MGTHKEQAVKHKHLRREPAPDKLGSIPNKTKAKKFTWAVVVVRRQKKHGGYTLKKFVSEEAASKWLEAWIRKFSMYTPVDKLRQIYQLRPLEKKDGPV